MFYPRSLNGAKILITGGTGSLGNILVDRILKNEFGIPAEVTVFSRDETKQYYMQMKYSKEFPKLSFVLGDVRIYDQIAPMVQEHDVIFNAAALKHVPNCEFFPEQAVLTNVIGPINIVKALKKETGKVVIGISTDKATAPANVMGMTKALQERIFIDANNRSANTFICTRYGNVLSSRGSAIPLFKEQISQNGQVTLTTEDMTRFFISLDTAVNIVIDAFGTGKPGDTLIPIAKSALIKNIAKAMIGERDIPIKVQGIRPGEKIHEELVSEEECHRCISKPPYYVIKPISKEKPQNTIDRPYRSNDSVMSLEETQELLRSNNLL
jgi:FlaA1/EpsC-like NDP-sugar epimerase